MTNNVTTQTNQPQIFQFNEKEVRVLLIEGKPWWVASDVCKILTIENVSQATQRLDDDEHLVYTLYISGQNRKIVLVNESGLYTLIMRSGKEEAKTFRRWVTHEVLPQITKTGNYISKKDSYMIDDPLERAKKWIEEETIRRQQAVMIETQNEEISELEEQLEEKTEKAECAERFLDFEVIGYDMNEAAQFLNLQLGGRNKLMEQLRKDKILMDPIEEVYYENNVKIIHKKNIPYRKFMESGYFAVKTSRTEMGSKMTVISTKTRVTSKGLEFLRKKYEQ